jgi:maltoporin
MLHASVNHERLLINSNTNKQWLGAGIRPIYKVTPNFHLVTEVGSSIVQNEGAKKLTRLTFAPQLSINDNIWGRPVLRAFYTHSFWSKNNKSNVAIDAPTYADKIHGGSYGLQMESFF